MVLADDLLHGRGMEGHVRWRFERVAVTAFFDDPALIRTVGIAGRFEAPVEIPVGTACHLALDDDGEMLIVVVGSGNRFLVCSELDD